jgi:hypothetical protein
MSFHIGDEVFVHAPDYKIHNEMGKIIQVVLPQRLSLNLYFNRTMFKIQLEHNYTTWVWEEHLRQAVVLCA